MGGGGFHGYLYMYAVQLYEYYLIERSLLIDLWWVISPVPGR